MSSGNSPSQLRKQQARRDRQQRWFAALVAEVDVVGAAVAEAAEARWAEHGSGPHWREALNLPAVEGWWKATTGMDYIGKRFAVRFMGVLRKSGWVAFNTRERSLCPGRRFYARQRPETSQALAAEVGRHAARFVGAFCDAYGHGPEWVHLAAAADDQGAPLFAGPEDAEVQFRWLVTRGWLSQAEGGGLRLGNRAEAEARRAAETPALVEV